MRAAGGVPPACRGVRVVCIVSLANSAAQHARHARKDVISCHHTNLTELENFNLKLNFKNSSALAVASSLGNLIGMHSLAASLAARMPAVAEIADPSGLLGQVSNTDLPGDIAKMGPTEPVLQGFLKVEWHTDTVDADAPGSAPEWRRCWAVMCKESLEIFRSRPDEASAQPPPLPVASIRLSEVTGIAAELPSCPVPNAFQLSTHERLWTLCAPLEAARRHWLTAIAGALVAMRAAAAQALESTLAALAVQLVKAEKSRVASAAQATAAASSAAAAPAVAAPRRPALPPQARSAPLPTALRQPAASGAAKRQAMGGERERSVKFLPPENTGRGREAAPQEASGGSVALQDLADLPLESFAAPGGEGSGGGAGPASWAGLDSSSSTDSGFNSYVYGASDEDNDGEEVARERGGARAQAAAASTSPQQHSSRSSSSSSQGAIPQLHNNSSVPKGTPGGAFTLRRSLLVSGGLTQSSMAKYRDPERASSAVLSIVEPARLSRIAAAASGGGGGQAGEAAGGSPPTKKHPAGGEGGAKAAAASAAAGSAPPPPSVSTSAAQPQPVGKSRLDYAKSWINGLRSASGAPVAALPLSSKAPCSSAGLGALFSNGVLLCTILEAAMRVKIEDVAIKPRARAQCLGNLEKALAVRLCCCCVCARPPSLFPSPHPAPPFFSRPLFF